ncbi:MAG: response regulator [Terracidiphilus sp.]
MTTDSMQPQVEPGPAPANGQGQAQGHRRRRRRRKNKSSQINAPQAQPPQAEPQLQTPPPRPQPQPAKHKPASAHQAARPGQGRRKKLFQKGSAAGAQPGNSIPSHAQGKRKGRQKAVREFVGPMDHSYRVVNGNIADGASSAMQISGNGHAACYEDLYEPQPPALIREDAPTRIFCFIEDLFFTAKIQETARKLGVKVEFVKGDKETLARLTDGDEAKRPKLLVFDLNNLNAKPISLIPKLKARLKKATSIVGFLNHLQGELKARAIEAGCDTVMPRSAFSQGLPNLLRRYGMEEEEEYLPQPV